MFIWCKIKFNSKEVFDNLANYQEFTKKDKKLGQRNVNSQQFDYCVIYFVELGFPFQTLLLKS